MCTVSYIPLDGDNQFVLTSNRDENTHRTTLPPKIYKQGEFKICYPKDSEAGGSWIAMNNHGRVLCLLNGAFKAHQKQKHHSNSRGKVLHQLISSDVNEFEYFDKLQLENTEPFTLLTVDRKNGKDLSFSEFIWDGSDKHFRELDKEKSYIWSSSTLYTEENRKIRRNWFKKFLQKNIKDINPKNIYEFHSSKPSANAALNFLMERENDLKTVSITQINNSDGLEMKYNDLLTQTTYQKKLCIESKTTQDLPL